MRCSAGTTVPWLSSTSIFKDGHIRCIVHQKSPHYRRTHLLEDGHKSRSGRSVRAQPHIRPVEEWAEREVLKAIEKAVKG